MKLVLYWAAVVSCADCAVLNRGISSCSRGDNVSRRCYFLFFLTPNMLECKSGTKILGGHPVQLAGPHYIACLQERCLCQGLFRSFQRWVPAAVLEITY